MPWGGGMFNVPQLGELNMLLQLAMPSLMQMAGNGTYIPAQFMPMQSLADQMRANLFARQTMEVMQGGMMNDANRMQQMLLNTPMGRFFGIDPAGGMAGATALTMAQDFARFAPMGLVQGIDFAFGRGTFDALAFQGRGTMPIAEGLFQAGQFRMDPFTGRWGARPENAVALGSAVRERLFGTPEAAAAMKGLTSTDVGDLFQELSARGFAPGLRSREDIARMRGVGANTIGDLDVQNVNADQISRKLQDLSGVVSAMRDIFGDAGRPNAPMRELINGLQALTQGGLATMTPGNLELSVRMTQNLARMSGMGIAGMMGLMTHGANMADRLGLDRSLAVQATQGAVAFGAAFGSTGAGATPAFGAFDREKMTLNDLQLRMQAAASPAANQMAAIVRMKNAGMLREGTEAYRIAEAVEQGQATYDGGKSVHMGTNQLRDIMQRSGINGATFDSILQQQPANQQFIEQFDIGSNVRNNFQRLEGQQVMGRSYGDALVGQLRAAGRASRGNIQRAQQLGQQAAAALMAVDGDVTIGDQKFTSQQVRSDRDLQRQFMTEFFQKNGGGLGIDFNAAAETGYGWFYNQMARNPALAGYATPENFLRSFDPATVRAQENLRQSAAAEGRLQSALAGVGTAGPLARISEILASRNISGEDALAGVLGGVKAAELWKIPEVQAWVDQAMASRNADRDKNGVLTDLGRKQVDQATRRARALYSGEGRDDIIKELEAKGNKRTPEEQRLLDGLRGKTVKERMEAAGIDVDLSGDVDTALSALTLRLKGEGGKVGDFNLGTQGGIKGAMDAIRRGKYTDVQGKEHALDMTGWSDAAKAEAKRIQDMDAKQKAEKEAARTMKVTGELTIKDNGKADLNGAMMPPEAVAPDGMGM